MRRTSLFFSLILYINCLSCAEPVIEIQLPGLLGNRLFTFCIGKILSDGLKFKLYCDSIWGFPNTYLYTNNSSSNSYPTEFMTCIYDLDIEKIINDHSLRNLNIKGYFQRYKYLQPYVEKIRNDWLKFDSSLLTKQDPNDIVIHIRTQYPPYFLPFEYYKKALDSTSYNRVFICIDEPNDPFLENFKIYNPIIKSTRSLNELLSTDLSWPEISKINLDDFFFMCSFNKIITSQSTYSWWAAFLSNAKEIYAPYYDNEIQVYGKVEEERYHYIDTVIGRATKKIIKNYYQIEKERKYD